jgi:hypothetical protein
VNTILEAHQWLVGLGYPSRFSSTSPSRMARLVPSVAWSYQQSPQPQ